MLARHSGYKTKSNNNDDNFDPKMDRDKLAMIEMLLEGYTKAAIAEHLRVSRQTIYDWLKQPEVQRRMKEEQEDIVDAGKKKILNKLGKYIDELDELAENSGDARTKLTALIYCIDRTMGKVPTKIETNETEKENIPDDMFEQAIAKAKAKLGITDNDNNSDYMIKKLKD
jgi:transposase-like protein